MADATEVHSDGLADLARFQRADNPFTAKQRSTLTDDASRLLVRIGEQIERIQQISTTLHGVKPILKEVAEPTPNPSLKSTIKLAHAAIDRLSQVVGDIEKEL